SGGRAASRGIRLGRRGARVPSSNCCGSAGSSTGERTARGEVCRRRILAGRGTPAMRPAGERRASAGGIDPLEHSTDRRGVVGSRRRCATHVVAASARRPGGDWGVSGGGG